MSEFPVLEKIRQQIKDNPEGTWTSISRYEWTLLVGELQDAPLSITRYMNLTRDAIYYDGVDIRIRK